jgi:hypothetical protein
VTTLPEQQDGKTRIAASSLRLTRDQQRAIDELQADLHGSETTPAQLPTDLLDELGS